MAVNSDWSQDHELRFTILLGGIGDEGDHVDFERNAIVEIDWFHPLPETSICNIVKYPQIRSPQRW